MRIGYARVSTGDQSLDLQVDALKRAGCCELFSDRGVSAVADHRPGLSSALSQLDAGDVLVIWRFDRLARSVRDLVDITTSLHNRDIGLQSLCEQIDTGSAAGRLILHVIGAVAEFERALIVERTKAGMQAAKERGVRFGREPALDGEAFREALFFLRQGLGVERTASQMGVGRSTLYRYLAKLRKLENHAGKLPGTICSDI